jgi:hypothetical protein
LSFLRDMKPMKFHLWFIFSSLTLGAILASIQPGNFLIGLLLFSFLFLLSFYVLRYFHRWSGGGRDLAWAMALAFLLRLALGMTLYLVLPLNENAAKDHSAGYVFFDAYRRDAQAWNLAQSDEPVWAAFNKTYYTDQYGGLLALSAASYRYLSSDAHRPLLPVIFGALTAALGLAFLWKAAAHAWGEKVAFAAAWIYALYPESILLGSAQMREPFLMGFMAMSLWGFVEQRAERSEAHSRSPLLWLALGFVGMLLISPIAGLFTLLLFVGWTWVQREHGRVSWIALTTAGLIFIAGFYLLAWGLEREQPFGSSPFGIVMNWSRDAFNWDVHQLERDSGWVQKLFDEMPGWLRPLFVMIYGITQPVLPATFIKPTTLTMRLLGIYRALGWYALVPLLFYAPFAAFRTVRGSARRLWLWLTVIAWLWIIVAAMRGGADQWDNPRYRAILILFESLVAGFAWINRDRWLIRWLAVEMVFLAVFTQWYVSRYYQWGGQLPFGWMVALVGLLAALILFGGWWWDRRKNPPP